MYMVTLGILRKLHDLSLLSKEECLRYLIPYSKISFVILTLGVITLFSQTESTPCHQGRQFSDLSKCEIKQRLPSVDMSQVCIQLMIIVD